MQKHTHKPQKDCSQLKSSANSLCCSKSVEKHFFSSSGRTSVENTKSHSLPKMCGNPVRLVQKKNENVWLSAETIFSVSFLHTFTLEFIEITLNIVCTIHENFLYRSRKIWSTGHYRRSLV